MAAPTLPCIFCPNPRTTKRGEHVWDDWLNRKDGKEIYDPSTTSYYGLGGKLIRQHPSVRMDVTSDVVCTRCNNEWMSDLSGRAKPLLEPIIRDSRPRDFNELDIVTLTAFAFMKSAVLDWQPKQIRRKPCISRTACLAFHHSLTSRSATGEIAFPDGLQVWLAWYRRIHRMEAQAFSEEMTGARQFKGYRILVITYIVGAFVFQLTYPRWTKTRRNRPPAPFFQVIGDIQSVPIWPDVTAAFWPPETHINSSTLESFRERFRRIRVPRFS
jgi:hypothetical protein